MNHTLPTFTALAIADPRRPATGSARPAYPVWSADPQRSAATREGATTTVRPPTFTNPPKARPS